MNTVGLNWLYVSFIQKSDTVNMLWKFPLFRNSLQWSYFELVTSAYQYLKQFLKIFITNNLKTSKNKNGNQYGKNKALVSQI